jgi:solute carrier family 50 (sugar transporter)
MYSIIQKDYFIYFANVPGIVLGVYYAINSMVLIAVNSKDKELPKEYRILEASLVGGPLAYSIVAMVVGISLPSSQHNVGRIIVAICANCCTVMYYASPLTTMYAVITTRDSSSLHPPMLLANLANSTMWLIYGLFALNDPFVYAPNGIGATLSGLQLSLCLIYPKKISTSAELNGSIMEQGAASNALHARASSQNGDMKARVGSHESFSIETHQDNQ